MSARTVDQLRREMEKLSADLVDAMEALTLVYRTVSALGGLFRLDDIAESLLARALEAVEGDAAVFYLLRGADEFEPVASEGDLAERLASDAPGRLAALGRALFLHGTLAAEYARPGEEAPLHLLSVPLETAGRRLGLLVVERREDRRFTTGDLKLVAALAGVAAVSLANFLHYRAVSFERRMLEGVIRSIDEGIAVCDDGWRSRLTNEAGRTLLGVEETEPEGFDVLGRLRAFELSVDPAVLRGPLDEAVSFSATSPDGVEPLVLRGSAFRARLGADGEPSRVLVLRDVTREASEEWAQRDFLSLASHKLRTPLTKVLGLLPILKEREVCDSLREEALRGVEGGARELDELIDGILRFVEFKHGQRVWQPIDVRAVIEGVVGAVRERRPDRQVEVEWRDEAPHCVVIGSKRMLETLFFHLVDNAVKFSPHRSAWVGVRLAIPVEGRLRVEVRDRGEGMPRDVLRRLFRPFAQADADFTGQAEGAGLGLMLARQAVEAHGGAIRARSKPGRGTVFVVDLPLERT